MNYTTIRRRLEAMGAAVDPGLKVVSVLLPDGSIVKRDAAEWWEHRNEWPLADFDHQDNRGGLVVCLVFAQILDSGIPKAKKAGNVAEVQRLTKERDDMLNLYFGDAER